MPEFLELLPPRDALARWMSSLSFSIESEEIETTAALGRVTSQAVVAAEPLPAFPRSTVDGYAVKAADTYGASDALPAYLQLIGEVPMGAAPEVTLGPAQCALIHTGGMLPQGADAVVMLEYTQTTGRNEIEVLRAAAVGENVLKVGEDVDAGEVVIPAGTRLRAAEIGGLMALGFTRVRVAPRPRVGIISSGDEVVTPGQAVLPGQVRDVNTYTLSALVEHNGGIPVCYGITPDREEALYSKARQALDECDVVVISAGSSASTRDLTARVINRLGEPGVLVHGVNVRPGKPSILAVCDGKAAIGLPGNPVSALVIARLFLSPLLLALQGQQVRQEPVRLKARLTLNIASQAGREDWVPVRLEKDCSDGEAIYRAEPVFGKSNLIFTLARADGLLRIPPEANGVSAGEVVEVELLE